MDANPVWPESSDDSILLTDEERDANTSASAPLVRSIIAMRRKMLTTVGCVFDLDWLIGTGPHVLRAVDLADSQFNLSGFVLKAIEDDQDGYRSSLSHVLVRGAWECKANIAPVNVRVERAPPNGWGDGTGETGEWWESFEGHAIVTAAAGPLEPMRPQNRLVLLIGTNHIDDYYPSFTFHYRPVGAP